MTSHMKLALHVMAGHTQLVGVLLICSCITLGNAPVAVYQEGQFNVMPGTAIKKTGATKDLPVLSNSGIQYLCYRIRAR